VVRYKEQRVQDPSDRVVDLLGRRERLVSAFVGNDPDTGTEETSHKLVQCPKGDLCGVESGGGEVEPREERINVHRAVNKGSDGDKVLDDVERRSDRRSVEAVGRDGIEQLLDSVVGDDELLALCSFLLLCFKNERCFLACTSSRWRWGALPDGGGGHGVM